MGGYMITNDLTESADAGIVDLFMKKGLVSYRRLDLGAFRLYYFDKINAPGEPQIYECEGGIMAGVGVFIYKDTIGREALQLLYRDLEDADSASVLNSIQGHYNLIIFRNGTLSVVTDRAGFYHSLIGRDNDKVYVSSSLFAVADRLPRLTIRKQEVMEFVITEAIYGPKTVFEEVDFLGFGQIHRLENSGEIASTQYHEEREAAEGFGLEEHYALLVNHFEPLRKLPCTISSDLSAGYDSRLVCSILKHMDIDHALNTNTNSWDSLDTRVALKISKEEAQEIAVYVKDLEKISYERLVRESLYKTELYRDAFQAAYSPVFFSEKTQDFDMILGGYGGELYRDTKYRHIDNYDDLVDKKYLQREMASIFSSEDIDSFRSSLIAKMREYVDHTHDSLTKRDCERIYYFMRMAYWGGARITYFNEYGYRYHPLLDYEVIYPLFQIGAAEKNDARFQMLITERFDHKMASYESGYGHSFLWNEDSIGSSLLSRLKKGIDLLRRLLEKTRKRPSSEAPGEDRSVWQDIVAAPLLMNNIFEGLHPQENESYIGRFYTIECLFRRYKERLMNKNMPKGG